MCSDDFDLPVEEYLTKHTDPNFLVSLIGYFPDTNETLIEGEIWLYRGRDSWNFGLDHIWAGRQLELKKRGVNTVRELINFLILMITKNTPIYPEPKHTKAAVVKSSKGAVIIENIADDYSAVTLLLATVARPLPVEKRWGNRRINTIKIGCKTI
ncbi:hypothetical protein FHQ26_00515 [Testudinibacter sp. TR-2022]|uniref:hypothetical protein n=1 Tax=Testudinibacter sp. TR-2022 TaxID=2585029 RepID=UPI00111BB781|nr:hypothetical protein [Testudinibacter sp. TR-2022]TNH04056.1 hypothetical protein FHQ22_05925 [Pasteurellaceae bacterium Phil31]TNH10159.1 hypothetical protein FHQ25_06050 [Testudinibacter sp. TR-2022]TNH13019.1 hypothetical protein FHQ26_00515 [Testudinibacter sp. TR-2022]